MKTLCLVFCGLLLLAALMSCQSVNPIPDTQATVNAAVQATTLAQATIDAAVKATTAAQFSPT